MIFHFSLCCTRTLITINIMRRIESNRIARRVSSRRINHSYFARSVFRDRPLKVQLDIAAIEVAARGVVHNDLNRGGSGESAAGNSAGNSPPTHGGGACAAVAMQCGDDTTASQPGGPLSAAGSPSPMKAHPNRTHATVSINIPASNTTPGRGVGNSETTRTQRDARDASPNRSASVEAGLEERAMGSVAQEFEPTPSVTTADELAIPMQPLSSDAQTTDTSSAPLLLSQVL